MLVARLVTVTVALAMLASCGSAMRPTKRPCSTCAPAYPANKAVTIASVHNIHVFLNRILFMALLFEIGHAIKGRVRSATKVVPLRFECQQKGDSRLNKIGPPPRDATGRRGGRLL